MGILHHFHHTIIGSLPDVLWFALPYILHEISACLYHFQHVTIKFLKNYTLIFFKELMVMRDSSFENC